MLIDLVRGLCDRIPQINNFYMNIFFEVMFFRVVFSIEILVNKKITYLYMNFHYEFVMCNLCHIYQSMSLFPSVPISIGSTTSTTIRLECGFFWRTTLQSEPIIVSSTKNTYINQHVHFNVKTLRNC